MSETMQVGSQTFVPIAERDELRRKLDLLLAAGAQASSAFGRLGYHNLPEALALSAAIEEASKP
jgi:hypothetical protein